MAKTRKSKTARNLRPKAKAISVYFSRSARLLGTKKLWRIRIGQRVLSASEIVIHAPTRTICDSTGAKSWLQMTGDVKRIADGSYEIRGGFGHQQAKIARGLTRSPKWRTFLEIDTVKIVSTTDQTNSLELKGIYAWVWRNIDGTKSSATLERQFFAENKFRTAGDKTRARAVFKATIESLAAKKVIEPIRKAIRLKPVFKGIVELNLKGFGHFDWIVKNQDRSLQTTEVRTNVPLKTRISQKGKIMTGEIICSGCVYELGGQAFIGPLSSRS